MDHTRIFLIRHGETVDEEVKKVYKGTLDIPLSKKGILTIKRVADFLSRYTIDFIYTSALSRCMESGRIIAGTKKLRIKTTASLNEIHFGCWEGLSFDEINASYPKEFRSWLKNPVKYTPPRGEPLLNAQERILKEFYEIVRKHKNASIAIIAHAGVLRIIISSLLSLKLSNMFAFSQDYGCINIVDVYENNKAVVKLLNLTLSQPPQ